MYFRVPASRHDDARLLAAGPAAAGVYFILGCWATRNETMGRVTRGALYAHGGSLRHVEALVDADLWEVDGDGWRFVEWRKAQDGRHRRKIPRGIRHAVYARDGRRCVHCGTKNDLTLGHVIPYREGGPDTVDNLRTECAPCNRSQEKTYLEGRKK